MTLARAQIERAKLNDHTMDEVVIKKGRRKISFGLKSKTGQKRKEHEILLRKLSAGCWVLVYLTSRERQKSIFKDNNMNIDAAVV